MLVQFLQLLDDDAGLAGEDLAPEPKHPIPEMRVDVGEVRGRGLERWFDLVPFVTGKEIDFDWTGQDQHVHRTIGEAIPLCGERLERSKEGREIARQRGWVRRTDLEVPI